MRHAHAGERDDFDGDDAERPLSPKGQAQAQHLVALLEAFPVSAVLSSPMVRCRQTVEPLAQARGLVVEPEPALAEGAGDDAVSLAQRLLGSAAVLCTHGDVIPAVLSEVAARGCLLPRDVRWQKGSTWVLEDDGRDWTVASYVPPPA